MFRSYTKTKGRQSLSSSATNVFLAKVWLPILCIVGALGLWGRYFPSQRSLMMVPPLILAAFGASTAILEVHNGSLRYRRLFRWKTIQKDQIIWAKVAWGSVLGSIRLNKNVFPWGRVYFALDKNVSSPFEKSESRLLKYIRDHISEPQGNSSANLHEAEPRAPVQKMVLAAVAGIGLNGFLRLLRTFAFGSSLLPPSNSPVELFLNFKFQAASTAVLIFLAIYRRRQKDGWIFALLAGMGLANIAFYWFKPML